MCSVVDVKIQKLIVIDAEKLFIQIKIAEKVCSELYKSKSILKYKLFFKF